MTEDRFMTWFENERKFEGGGGVPYPNMQLDTEPFKNKSLERSGLFSIISCATDIALAPSATRRVFLKLESRRLNA